MSVHFFTGFPGFIASQLIRQVFKDGKTKQVFAVVLAPDFAKAQQEKENIKAEYPHCQIELFEGDITLPNLGICNLEIVTIRPRISVLWHLAAIYDLAVPRKIAWKVNVHGTACVNEFARVLPNLKRYMYFSTAYVAGKRTGTLFETELVRPAEFKNFYEETKFEAELRVEDLKKELPITIIRPAIVRGHSETGATVKFDGPYFFLNMIDCLRGVPFVPHVGSKVATLNVVPVDYIFNAASYISTSPDAVGKTLHLTDPNPHVVNDVFREMVKEMTGKYPFGRLPIGITKVGLGFKKVRQKLGVECETIDYLDWEATFDCSEAQKILSTSGILCMDFMDTLPAMVSYYNANKNTKQYHIVIK